MDREERAKARYARFFGDLVPRERREHLAEQRVADRYADLYIEPIRHKRSPEDLEGKRLSKRETKRLLRELEQEMAGVQ